MKWLLLLTAFHCLPVSADEYRFIFDGRPIEARVMSIGEDAKNAEEGIVGWLERYPLVLGKAGTCEFSTERRKEGIVLGRFPGEAGFRPVFVIVSMRYEGDGDATKEILVDPLATMSAEDKAGLRGVLIKRLPKDMEKSFEGVPWSQTVLCFENADFTGEALRLLPEKLCYLLIRNAPDDADLSAVWKMKQLLWLAISGPDEIDCSDVMALGKLRSLDLSHVGLKQVGSLAALKDLRHLSLRSAGGSNDIGFTASLPKLQSLDVSGTGVGDLRPLGKLSELQEVDAGFTHVTRLPDGPGLVALKKLRLLSVKVPAAEIAGFRKVVPACRIDDTWHGALLGELDGVDRMRVRSLGFPDPSKAMTLFELLDPAAIRREVESWTIQERDGISYCLCDGGPIIEFYQGERLVATVGVQHGQSLRWRGWVGDAELTQEGADSLCRLLGEHGIDGPGKELEESREAGVPPSDERSGEAEER